MAQKINTRKIKRLLKDKSKQNTFFFLLLRGASVVSSYLLSIIILQYFSKSDYGMYIYSLSVFMILSSLFKGGLDIHEVKMFSEQKEKSIPAWVKTIERKIIIASFIFAFTITGINFFFNKSSEKVYFLSAFVLVTPIYVRILLSSAKLRGVQKIINFAFLNIAGRVILTTIIIVFFYSTLKIDQPYAIALAHVCAVVGLFFVSEMWIRKTFSMRNNNSKIPEGFSKYNNALMFKSYLTVMFLWGDRFLLSLVSSNESVAEYDICLKISMLIYIFLEAIKSSYAPLFSNVKNNRIEVQKKINESTKLGFILSGVIFLIIVFLGKGLLGLFGLEFETAYTILLVISSGYVVSSFFGQADSVVEMTGIAHNLNKFYAITVFSCLSLGTILSIYIGALGMAIGISTGNVFYQLTSAFIVKRKINLKTALI